MVNTKAIKDYAKKRGKKVGEICQALGYHPNKLSDVAKGRSSFTDSEVIAIAKMLDVMPEELTDDNTLDGSIAERLFDPDLVYETLEIDVQVVDGITYITLTAESEGGPSVHISRKRVHIQCKDIRCTINTNPLIK